MKRTLVCALSCVVLLLASAIEASADERATVTGYLTDAQGLKVAEARIQITNIDTNVSYVGESNEDGLFRVVGIPTGTYRIVVQKTGFKTIVKQGVELHVQDVIAFNFQLEIGSVAESVTVAAGAPLINMESAAVSTVVDRQFVENLPLNGRSFQTLIQLTPGVVLTASNSFDPGQFSVNGQRASSNYWMVDGVSANLGVGATVNGSNGTSGSVGSFSVVGGTNSLVSVDALQEFRIQTSTYAPEFGRLPGGQISIVNRSWTNRFHGTVFDYLRNDVLDANDWFANRAGLRKPQERQNDFGGTFSGPIVRDKAFFFFSYEGLRLRLPRTALTTVPCNSTCTAFGNARTMAVSQMQPYLNAFPLPNGPEVLDANQMPTGAAEFNSSFSDRSTLDAYSLRIDQKMGPKAVMFGRYNYSPSELRQRPGLLSNPTASRILTQTATIGITWAISPSIANDLRFNYSLVEAKTANTLDSFGNAVPLTSLPFPSPFTPENGLFNFQIFSLAGGGMGVGKAVRNTQKQINIVDNFSWQRSSHSFKFGMDFRRLSPQSDPPTYAQEALFVDVPSAAAGNLLFGDVRNSRAVTFLFRNLSAFAQDTWRITPRLTLTYGLRWDADFAPSTLSGPGMPAATGFNLHDLSRLALAPAGTPPFKTPYGGVAPRFGIAYQLFQDQTWQTVVRGGFGIFYDLATSEVGNLLNNFLYPFGVLQQVSGSTFPLDPADAALPPITPPGPTSGTLTAFDPNLSLPRTFEWNVALEQGLGASQSISLSYIGSAGRQLLQTAFLISPNSNYAFANLISNSASSDYDAFQLQFQRRLSRGLQGLASYTWSHSIDTGSAGSTFIPSNTLVPSIPEANRAPSDFDVRQTFSAAMTYDIPTPKINVLAKAVLRGWSVQNVIQGRSSPPVDISNSKFFFTILNSFANVRPDRVPGMSFYVFGVGCVVVFGSPCPGGKGFNPAAFTDPPTDPNTGAPLRQGNLGRNALRGFGLIQWDFAVHRDFPVRESLKVQFRAGMFNVLNHPNFGPPTGDLSNPQFGRSTQMLGASLDFFNQGGGSFSPLYQIGGPRSVQFALKLLF